MKPFFSLLGLSFKSLILNSANTGRSRGKRSQAATSVGAMVLIGGVMVYLSGTYSFMLGSAFAGLGALDIMLGLMMLMATVWPLFFILFGSQGLIFSTKDVDLVLSLPVSSFTVMLARVLALYLEALFMCELMLIPAGAAYLFYGGANGVGVLLLLMVEGFFMALLPTFVALVFGSLVALVVSRLPFKNLFTVIFSLLLVVGIMAASMSLSFMAEGDSTSLLGLRDTLSGIPLLNWALPGAMGNVGYLLLFAAACAAPFLLVVWVFSRFYKGMLTRLSSHRLRTDYKLRDLKTRGSFAALFAKETRRFFGTPAYLLNSGSMLFLLLIGGVAAIVFKGTISEVMTPLSAAIPSFQTDFLAPLVLVIVCFACAFVFVSPVSISLEGKTLWILKEAPVSTGRIFTAKAGINFLLGGVTCALVYPMLGYALGMSPLNVLLMLLVTLLFCLLTSTSGLFINLLLPRLDAENETMVIKQSASVLVSMLVDMVFVGLFVGLYFLTRNAGFALFCLAASAVLVLLNAGSIALLNTKGQRLFAAL